MATDVKFKNNSGSISFQVAKDGKVLIIIAGEKFETPDETGLSVIELSAEDMQEFESVAGMVATHVCHHIPMVKEPVRMNPVARAEQARIDGILSKYEEGKED